MSKQVRIDIKMKRKALFGSSEIDITLEASNLEDLEKLIKLTKDNFNLETG